MRGGSPEDVVIGSKHVERRLWVEAQGKAVKGQGGLGRGLLSGLETKRHSRATLQAAAAARGSGSACLVRVLIAAAPEGPTAQGQPKHDPNSKRYC